MNPEMDEGVQPLDKIMKQLMLTDADLVDRSTDNLTFKMMLKARKGRRLKARNQLRVLRALNDCCLEQKFTLEDIFTYKGPPG
jgi:hypothetical protein